MTTTADVVIIGAGTIGCSTAYHLARLGIRDVVVVEMGRAGSGTSSKSASMLSLQFGHDELMVRMAQAAYARFMQFDEEFGVPIDFKQIGLLALATEASAGHLRRNAGMTRALGIATDLLTPDEVKQRYPAINTEDIVLGAFGPDDGVLDAHMVVTGYVRRARELGARVREGVKATGIQVRAGKVEGVETTEGFISAALVVNAGGPWAIEIGRWVGANIPILNSARSIVVTPPFPDIPSDWPFVEDLTVEWYCRPEGPGMLMGMGAAPTDKTEIPFRREAMDDLFAAAIHRIPAFERASILAGWTGVRPMTLDDRPILGPVEGVEGFVLNCGWGGAGVMLSPVAGQMLSDYLAGAANEVLAPFAAGRFAGLRTADIHDLRILARAT